MAQRTDGTGIPSTKFSRVRFYALLGVLGPAVYVAAVILGGWLWPGYSHYGETVSTLTSRGAPNQEILMPLFAAYNVCLVALAFGLQSGIEPRPYGLLGPAFLAAAGVDGLVLFLFPQEPWGSPQFTPTGTGHVIVAGFGALFFLLAIAFLWRRLRADPRWARFGQFSVAILGLSIVVGAFTAGSVTAPYAGLAERLSIGTFLLWTEALAVGLYQRSSVSRHSATPDHRERPVPG